MLHWIPALITAAVLAWLSHQPVLPPVPGAPPDWLLHGLAYGFLALTCIWGTTRGLKPELRRRGPLLLAFLLASGYGITDEWHQSFVGRDATVSDWLADTVGAGIAALAVLLAWRRRNQTHHTSTTAC